jgi:enoyl-CoA hydratase/carnithine racemase
MDVEIERHEGWAQLMLNRPERRNAIVGPLASELAAAIRTLDDDEEVQAILLCGAGGAFCSGLDLKEFNADPEPEWLADFGTAWRSVHVALFECATPIVGALERFAINGGAALALACDLLIVGEDSYLQIGEVRQGMGAPYNLAWLALRHPEAVGLRLSLIGDRVPGPALVDLGVAYDCVADEEVLHHATALSAAIADYPPGAARRIKATMAGLSRGDATEWFERATGRGTSAGRMKPRAVDR